MFVISLFSPEVRDGSFAIDFHNLLSTSSVETINFYFSLFLLETPMQYQKLNFDHPNNFFFSKASTPFQEVDSIFLNTAFPLVLITSELKRKSREVYFRVILM